MRVGTTVSDLGVGVPMSTVSTVVGAWSWAGRGGGMWYTGFGVGLHRCVCECGCACTYIPTQCVCEIICVFVRMLKCKFEYMRQSLPVCVHVCISLFRICVELRVFACVWWTWNSTL